MKLIIEGAPEEITRFLRGMGGEGVFVRVEGGPRTPNPWDMTTTTATPQTVCAAAANNVTSTKVIKIA